MQRDMVLEEDVVAEIALSPSPPPANLCACTADCVCTHALPIAQVMSRAAVHRRSHRQSHRRPSPACSVAHSPSPYLG